MLVGIWLVFGLTATVASDFMEREHGADRGPAGLHRALSEQLLAPTDGTGDLAQNLTVNGAGPVAHRRGALLT